MKISEFLNKILPILEELDKNGTPYIFHSNERYAFITTSDLYLSSESTTDEDIEEELNKLLTWGL